MILGRDVLLDTGPLVALLDGRDAWSAPVRKAWPALAAHCLVPEQVVVEASHLVGRKRGDTTLVLETLLRLEIPIFASHLPLHQDCVYLMHRYADGPMDYADAVLVALADRLNLDRIFTLDRRGFSTWRGSRGKLLDLVPLDQP